LISFPLLFFSSSLPSLHSGCHEINQLFDFNFSLLLTLQ